MNNRKILVVDDEGIVLDSCQRVLEAEGFKVLLAPTVDAALEAIEKESPVALLVDIKMPERDGIDLMREVRKKSLHIPIIVMSGYTTIDTISQSAKMGAATFIPKPFTPDELIETVHKVLKMEILPVFSHKKGEG